jgi:DNA polymerase-3 subunit alpha
VTFNKFPSTKKRLQQNGSLYSNFFSILVSPKTKGIIVTTGCLSSPMNKNLLHGDREAAEEWVKFFIDNFEHVFVELQRNGVEESEKLIPTQIEIAKKYNLEMVATCDSHYINKADSD